MEFSVFKKQGRYSLLQIIFVFLGFSPFLSAQIPSNDTTAYYDALNNLWPVINRSTPLPLGGFDSLRPAFFSSGLEDDTVLWQTLNTYVPVGRLEFKNNEFSCHWPGFPKRTDDFNLAIIAIHKEKSNNPALRKAASALNIPVIYIFFGKPVPNRNETLRSRFTFIINKEDTPWAQSLSAQLIFGGTQCEDTYNRVHAVQPDHQSSKDCQRFSFAPPSVMGMDADLMEDSIAAIVQDGLAHHAFPGAQVLVAKNGVIVYHKAFGFHTDQQKRPVQLTDIYDIASVTKISSGLAALMRWHGEGEFELDAPLKKYYPNAKGNKKELTYRNILAHNARLRPWIPYWQNTLKGNGRYPWSRKRDPMRINDYDFRRHTFERDSSENFPIYITDDLWQHRDYKAKMMKAIMKSPLNEEGGYRYSGLFFYLLPELVAQKSGMDFETYLQQTFYQPLGAYTLGYNPLKRFNLDQIIPTERDTFFRMTQIHGHVHDEGAAMMDGVSCNAGLFTNAYDLAKLQLMYLYYGKYGGQQFIAEESLKEFTRCQFPEADNRRGLGFDKPLLEYDADKSSVAEAASKNSFGHSGYTGTFTWADPDSGLLFIFLSNRVYPSRTNKGVYTLNIRPRIHTVLYEAMKKNKKS